MAELALKLFRREWRAGELNILMAALIIAIAALTAIGSYTDRMTQGLEQQAAELLGGDLVLISPTPPSSIWKQKINASGLKTAEMTLFSTVASTNDSFQLINVKAVSKNYPLRGEVRTILNPGGTEQIEQETPKLGTVWVDIRLLQLLKIKMGSTMKIGSSSFIVSRIINYEPDTQPYNLNIAPRVLMNEEDLSKTQIIQPGSRVEYRWLMMGNNKAVDAFTAWGKSHLLPSQKLTTAEQGTAELKTTLQRMYTYLNLAAIASVILSGIAIAMAARHYSQRHYDVTALLRCFGVTQPQILRIYLLYLLFLGCTASAVGIILGYIIQILFAFIFSNLLTLPLPTPSLWPALFSWITGLIILFGFALPPILALKNIPPLRVLRRDGLSISPNTLLSYSLPCFVIMGLLLWYTEDLHLTLWVFFGFFSLALVLCAAAWLLIKLASSLRSKINITYRYGIANLIRRARSSMVQLVAFGLVIMILLLLIMIRTDLLAAWQKQLPANAPNYFAVNIQAQEIEPLTQLLQQYQITPVGIYPMVRGRLTLLNSKPVQEAVPAKARSNNALHRELNLTWTNELPQDNKIMAGTWGKGLSMEAKLAKDLNIKLGDELTFQIGDQQIQGTIQSLRSVEWDSFRPNFYVIFPPGILDKQPATYITSFYVSSQNKAVLTNIVKNFPGMTVIDMAALLAQVRDLTNKMAWAIELILCFTLAAGFAVLYAALQASRDERTYESVILRTLGASSHRLRSGLAAEFITLGALAGLLGAIGASATTAILATQIFKLSYQLNLWYWLAGTVSGMILIGVAGLYGTRHILKQSPVAVLQTL